MPESPQFDLAQVLGYLVVRVAAALEDSFTEVMATEGLTVRQFGILAQIHGAGTLTAAGIARRLDVTAQAVGPQIETLVARGLAERTPGHGRGQPIDVRLTPAGRTTFFRAARLAGEENERTTGHLDAHQRQTLFDQLTEIGRRAGAPRT